SICRGGISLRRFRAQHSRGPQRRAHAAGGERRLPDLRAREIGLLETMRRGPTPSVKPSVLSGIDKWAHGVCRRAPCAMNEWGHDLCRADEPGACAGGGGRGDCARHAGRHLDQARQRAAWEALGKAGRRYECRPHSPRLGPSRAGCSNLGERTARQSRPLQQAAGDRHRNHSNFRGTAFHRSGHMYTFYLSDGTGTVHVTAFAKPACQSGAVTVEGTFGHAKWRVKASYSLEEITALNVICLPDRVPRTVPKTE